MIIIFIAIVIIVIVVIIVVIVAIIVVIGQISPMHLLDRLQKALAEIGQGHAQRNRRVQGVVVQTAPRIQVETQIGVPRVTAIHTFHLDPGSRHEPKVTSRGN